MAKPKPALKYKIKCKQWKNLCASIRFSYPDIKIRAKGKDYAITYKNLKEFLQRKSLIAPGGEPSFESMNSGWIQAKAKVRLNPEGLVHSRKWELVVSEYGYSKIIRLLQGKRVKFLKEKQAPRIPDLTIEQTDRLKELHIEIKANLKDYVIVGVNLIEIQKLIRFKGKSFGEYTQEHFGFDYPRALQQIRAVKTVCGICNISPALLKEYHGSSFKEHIDHKELSQKIQSSNKMPMLDRLKNIEAVPPSSYPRRVLAIFDCERKVRAISCLTSDQQKELVGKLLTMQNEKQSDFSEADIKASVEQFIAGSKNLSESDIDFQQAQSDLVSISNKLKKLAAGRGNAGKWDQAVSSIKALIEKPETNRNVPF